jgi:hypothetical protein
MKRIILFICFFCFTSALFHLQAQSIHNTSWKAFFGDPFQDTLTVHFQTDSSFVTNSKGEILVRSTITVAGDIVTISDYGTEQYNCPDGKGSYKFSRSGDTLVFTLINDPCDGRARTLNGLKWLIAPTK